MIPPDPLDTAGEERFFLSAPAAEPRRPVPVVIVQRLPMAPPERV
jgi:hypothetical protein